MNIKTSNMELKQGGETQRGRGHKIKRKAGWGGNTGQLNTSKGREGRRRDGYY